MSVGSTRTVHVIALMTALMAYPGNGAADNATAASSPKRELARLLIQSYMEENREALVVADADIDEAIRKNPGIDRDKARDIVLREKGRELLGRYFRQLCDKLHVTRVTANFPEAMKVHDRLLNRPKEPRQQNWILTKQVKSDLTLEERNLVLATFDGGQITLEDWFEVLCQIVPPRRPRDIRTREGIDQILDSALKIEVFAAEAKLLGLDKSGAPPQGPIEKAPATQGQSQTSPKKDEAADKIRSTHLQAADKPTAVSESAIFENNAGTSCAICDVNDEAGLKGRVFSNDATGVLSIGTDGVIHFAGQMLRYSNDPSHDNKIPVRIGQHTYLLVMTERTDQIDLEGNVIGIGSRLRFDSKRWVAFLGTRYRAGSVEITEQGLRFLQGTQRQNTEGETTFDGKQWVKEGSGQTSAGTPVSEKPQRQRRAVTGTIVTIDAQSGDIVVKLDNEEKTLKICDVYHYLGNVSDFLEVTISEADFAARLRNFDDFKVGDRVRLAYGEGRSELDSFERIQDGDAENPVVPQEAFNDCLIYAINVFNRAGVAPPDSLSLLQKSAEAIAKKYDVPLHPATRLPYVHFPDDKCLGVFDAGSQLLAPHFLDTWVDPIELAGITDRGSFPKIYFRGFRVILSNKQGKYVVAFPEGARAKSSERLYEFKDGTWVEVQQPHVEGRVPASEAVSQLETLLKEHPEQARKLVPQIEKTMVEELRASAKVDRFTIPEIKAEQGGAVGSCTMEDSEGFRVVLEFDGDRTASGLTSGGAVEVRDIFADIQQQKPKTVPTGAGSVHRFKGTVKVPGHEGFVFAGEGDELNRLTFLVTPGGYVYLRGKGKVVMKDHETVLLGRQ